MTSISRTSSSQNALFFVRFQGFGLMIRDDFSSQAWGTPRFGKKRPLAPRTRREKSG